MGTRKHGAKSAWLFGGSFMKFRREIFFAGILEVAMAPCTACRCRILSQSIKPKGGGNVCQKEKGGALDKRER